MTMTTEETAVWARVRPGEPWTDPAEELLRLRQALFSQAGSWNSREAAGTLCRQARTLGALYRYLTGQRPPAPGPSRSSRDPAELLRDLETDAGRLEALSVRLTGESGVLLRELAEADRRLFRGQLERLLSPGR